MNADELYQKALELLEEVDFVSVSYFQDKLCIGYPAGSKLLQRLIKEGLVERASTSYRHKVIKNR